MNNTLTGIQEVNRESDHTLIGLGFGDVAQASAPAFEDTEPALPQEQSPLDPVPARQLSGYAARILLGGLVAVLAIGGTAAVRHRAVRPAVPRAVMDVTEPPGAPLPAPATEPVPQALPNLIEVPATIVTAPPAVVVPRAPARAHTAPRPAPSKVTDPFGWQRQ